MLNNIIIAGTFNMLHSGHEALLKKALSSGRRITVGITSDDFARKSKSRKVNPFEKRKAAIVQFLGKDAPRASFYKLEDTIGNSTFTTEHDGVVVSQETEPVLVGINRIRKRKGLIPLKIISVPTVYADDYKPVSSSRIASGEIDSHGKRRRKLVFSIGSTNRDKANGARSALSKFFNGFSVTPVKAESGVGPQPFNEKTMQGASNRAKAAFKNARCDFGIGLESGLFSYGGFYYDTMCCAIFDGKETLLGFSMGFAIPAWLADEARSKGLKKAFQGFGAKSAGGVIKALSSGRISREEMAEQACACALVHLINRGRFEAAPRKHL